MTVPLCELYSLYLYFLHNGCNDSKHTGQQFIVTLSNTGTLYFVLHPWAQKAISLPIAQSFEANMAAERTDRQTICRFWLGLTGSLIEEDGGLARSATPSSLILLEGAPNCLTLEVKSTLDAKFSLCTHTHTETHTCLPADCGYCRSVSGPLAMGWWLAGKWLLCLQHGRRIQAHTVLDLKLYLSCINLD